MTANLENSQDQWDKKKVGMAVCIVFLIIAGYITVKQIYFPTPKKTVTTDVKGIETSIKEDAKKASFSLPNVSDLQNKVDQIKDQVAHIDVAQVASSSPQVQDIIQQIKNLPQLPASVAKDVCEQLCKKL